MSIKLFTEKEISLLSKNLYIKNISVKSITYTDEFKRIFIAESEKGKPSRVVFEEHGFDVGILGMNRVEQARRRWKS
jgi:hypothetical protein